MSEWPFRYLVVECTTTSKPRSSGRCTHGLAKVLSAPASTPRRRASAATAARSASFSVGLVGLSTHSSFVSGRIARSTASRSVKSTRVAVSPIERCRTRSSSRNVPPYRSSVVTMCEPASRHSSTVAIAARPEANANACVPFSRSATQRSKAKRVGLWLRP